ncbi:MAG: hypothetical protein JWO92_499 [Chitinophagaceae bacterium]|nr:hypothetical protein [Chitinophagaceae bacterium]
MKYLLIITLFFSVQAKGQTDTAKLYYSEYALTNWFFWLYPDHTFEYYSNGHLSFQDTVRGTYRISGDTLYTRVLNLKDYKNNPNYMTFKKEGDSCLIELYGINQKFCRQKQD